MTGCDGNEFIKLMSYTKDIYNRMITTCSNSSFAHLKKFSEELKNENDAWHLYLNKRCAMQGSVISFIPIFGYNKCLKQMYLQRALEGTDMATLVNELCTTGQIDIENQSKAKSIDNPAIAANINRNVFIERSVSSLNHCYVSSVQLYRSYPSIALCGV